MVIVGVHDTGATVLVRFGDVDVCHGSVEPRKIIDKHQNNISNNHASTKARATLGQSTAAHAVRKNRRQVSENDKGPR